MKLYNIVKVYTSTVGTGTVTLGSAVPSFITFATAGVITGSIVSYAIEDGNNREVGTGVYTSGAETLTRTVVTSTNSNNAITLSGNAVVFITGLAADLSSDTAATANTLVIRDGSGNFALGTPTSGTLTNCTGLPVSTGISGLGANVATFLATPSSANLASVVTDETGSGALVFGTSPTIATPTITTSATVPLVIGGTGTTSTLTLRSTSGVGTTGADIIFQAGNNGATEVMRLQNGGNVGIGTTSPSSKLQVSIDSASYGETSAPFTIRGATDSNKILAFGFHTTDNVGWIQSAQFGTAVRPLALQPNSGNVGIGTTSPVLALHVVGTQGGPATSGTTPTGTARFVTVNSVMDIGSRSNGNTWMQVTDRTNLAQSYNLELNPNGGNVGIGTSSPLTKLQVGAVAGLGGTDGNTTLSAGTNMIYQAATSGAALTWNANTNGGFSNTVMARLQPRQDTSANYNLDVFCGTWNNNNNPGTAVATFQSTGNVGIGTSSPSVALDVQRSSASVQIRAYTGTVDLSLLASHTGGAGFIGTSSAHPLIFATNGTEKMRIDSSGNVGIGTATSPAIKLHVLTANPSTANEVARFQGGTNSSNFRNYISCYTTNTGYWWELSNEDSAGTGSTNGFAFRERSAADPSVVRLYLASGGNVGIGTTSPSRQLMVNGTGQNTSAITDAGNQTASIFISSTNGTGGAGGALLLGGTTSAIPTVQWAIKSIMINAVGNGTADLAFATRAGTGDTSLTERMRILVNGNVAIGSSAAARKLTVYEGTAATADVGVRVEHVSNKPAYMEFVTTQRTANFGLGNYSGVGFTGAMQLVCDGGFHICPSGTGNVGIGTANPLYQLQLSLDSAAKPTTNTWTIASDSRLKTVKGEYQKGLAEICQVRPVSYEYNGKAGFIADGKDKVSILAQELMQVFPECVDTFKGKLEEDGPEIDLYNYNGHAITFALINAIKELKAKIDILEARN